MAPQVVGVRLLLLRTLQRQVRCLGTRLQPRRLICHLVASRLHLRAPPVSAPHPVLYHPPPFSPLPLYLVQLVVDKRLGLAGTDDVGHLVHRRIILSQLVIQVATRHACRHDQERDEQARARKGHDRNDNPQIGSDRHFFFRGGFGPRESKHALQGGLLPAMPRRALLAACLVAVMVAAGGVRGEEGSVDSAEPTDPPPVAQMTLMMTDGSGAQTPVEVTVLPDEDAAAAAVRFCFSKGLTAPQQVLDIVGYLKGALEGKGHEPDNIELLRTAGAYSRRAAESAKEESYADAAAGTHPPRCLPSCNAVSIVAHACWDD